MSLLDQYAAVEPVEVEPQSPNTLGALIELYETVSEEAFVVGDLNNYLQRRAAKITATVQDVFRHLTTFNFKRPETLNTSALSRALNTRDYTDMIELTVYVPVGFTGELKNYVALLAGDAERMAATLIHEVIQPAKKCIAHYINQPQDTDDTRGLLNAPQLNTPALASVKEKMGVFHIAGNRRSTAELGEVFENKAAIVTTADTLNKLNQSLWRQVPPERVEREAEELVKLATALFGSLQSSDQGSSPEFVKSLTELLKDVGERVEWYATYQTRLMDVTAAMRLNEKILLDIQD